jgi:hypothetical protein
MENISKYYREKSDTVKHDSRLLIIPGLTAELLVFF